MTRQEHLKQWVAERYADRTIPISGEPYLHHVLAVAEIAAGYTQFGYEIGLCHDMLEDHICTQQELQKALTDYQAIDAQTILEAVGELTDRIYPGLKKKQRRQLEEDRLTTISPAAQTVKYADLIYNMNWTVSYEPQEAKSYLKRKLGLLNRMDKGNPELRQKAIDHAYRYL